MKNGSDWITTIASNGFMYSPTRDSTSSFPYSKPSFNWPPAFSKPTFGHPRGLMDTKPDLAVVGWEPLHLLMLGCAGTLTSHSKIEAPDLFESERDAFLRMKDGLLSDGKYRGKFVAILKGSVVDFDDDKVKLAKRVYAKHGYVPVYMDRVEEKRRILDMPSPETHRK